MIYNQFLAPYLLLECVEYEWNTEMYHSLKPVLISLQVLGFCSLKIRTCKERHRWYYLWSVILLTLGWINVLGEGFPIRWKIYDVLTMLINSFMMVNILLNEKKLVDILENMEYSDFKIDTLKRGNCGLSMIWTGCVMYQVFKIQLGITRGVPTRVLVSRVAVSLPNIMVTLLSCGLYDELALHFSALSQLLSFSDTDDLCFSLESARLSYFSLRDQVCSLNSFLGFPLLCSILNGQILIFIKFLVVLDKYFIGSVLLVPDELLQIFHLTSTAHSLEHQVRVYI